MTRSVRKLDAAGWSWIGGTLFRAQPLLWAFVLTALGFCPRASADYVRLVAHPTGDCVVGGLAVNAIAQLRVAFESTCDFAGTNGDANREIFSVDKAGEIVQLTDTTNCTNTNPASDASGEVIVYESDCDLGSNSDGNIEIYRVSSQSMTQLTVTSFCTNLAPSVNSDAGLVAFDSDCDLIGANLDGSVEVFQLAPGGSISQLTDDGGGVSGCASINAASDASGSAVAFESDCDLTGRNGDQVNEIFQYRHGVGVIQLTTSVDEPCVNATPATSDDGMTIAFSSDCDLTGDNQDNSSEIFVSDRDAGERQISNSPGADNCESLSPFLRNDGGSEVIVFSSYCELARGNQDGSYEIYRAIDGAIAALTNQQDCASFGAEIAGDGETAVFLSDCDLTGAGSDGLGIYSTDLCACGAPISRGAPTATDSLLALNAAVGNASCALCDCDVNGDTRVTASDALLILNQAVGVEIGLSCS